TVQRQDLHEIEVAPALVIPQPGAFAAHEDERRPGGDLHERAGGEFIEFHVGSRFSKSAAGPQCVRASRSAQYACGLCRNVSPEAAECSDGVIWSRLSGGGMTVATGDERSVVISSVPTGQWEYRLALAIVLVSAAVFAVAAPFAKTPLTAVPAFLPIYQSALVINDVITAVLLYGQYNILRSRAVLVLASGYLFCALMAV